MLRCHYSAIKESEQPVWMMSQSFYTCPNVHYTSILRIKFNEILLECIHLGLCVKDCDTFLFSAFLSIRLENIKNGVIYPQKEKTPGLSNFVIKSMLMGYMTDKGKEHIISI